MTEQARPNAVFRAATTPARLLSRFRTDLGASLREDAATFVGPAARLFLVLAALAIAYPIIASVVHAQAPGTARAEPITYALAPFFSQVFAESQPFMIAAFAIGAFSPALGVLFVVAFLPADLIAAAVHCGSCGSGGPPELVAPQGMAMWQGPIVARLISYGLLWILAVEIPLRVRRWATAWASRGGRQPSVLVSAAAAMVGTAVLAFFWVRALPFLISPVWRWTVVRENIEASNATLELWPIFVIGTTAIAGVAAIWPRPVRVSLDPAAFSLAASRNVTSVRRTVVRQTVAVLVLTALFAGLATDLLEAAILIGGLLAAGPLVTLALPRLRVPRWLPPARSLARWIMAMVIALAVSQAILILALDMFERPYLLLVLTLAVAAPLFRLLLEAGPAAPTAADVQRPRAGPPPAVITSMMVVFAVVLWLALPTLVLGHNWTEESGELKEALQKNLALAAGLMGGLLGGIAGAMKSPPPPPPPEWEPFPSPPPLVPAEPDWGARRQMRREAEDMKDMTPPHPPASEFWNKFSCVLTTACVTALGLPDDCHELVMFRRLRDEYLRRRAKGIAVIEDYYRTAPHVVAAVQVGTDPDAAWRRIYGEWVEPVVKLVDAGEFDEAVDLALSRYEAIKREYGVS